MSHYNKPRLKNIYGHMKDRCCNPNSDSYKYYGGRGIRVCDEWLSDYKVFEEWAFNHGYSKELTLDRIDVNGNYDPSNCRWISRSEQMCNTRRNRLVTYKGVTKTVKEWASEKGINYRTLHNRLFRSKWPVKLALEVK